MSAHTPYATPKLDGLRVALRGRISPAQHKLAHEAASRYGLSVSDYMGALIDRDNGLPNKIDDHGQGALIDRAS